jgi:hypothetical protein
MNKTDSYKRVIRALRKQSEQRHQVEPIVSKPTVDRTYEFAEPDNEIVVTLEDGYTERFWLKGLTDEEYIKRARYLRDNA